MKIKIIASLLTLFFFLCALSLNLLADETKKVCSDSSNPISIATDLTKISKIFEECDREKLIHFTNVRNLLAILKDGKIRSGKATGVSFRLANSPHVFLEAKSNETVDETALYLKRAHNNETAMLVFSAKLLNNRTDFHISCNWNHFGEFDTHDSAKADNPARIKKILKRVNDREEDDESGGLYSNEIVLYSEVPLEYLERIIVPDEQKPTLLKGLPSNGNYAKKIY